jgi:hypothetical protein
MKINGKVLAMAFILTLACWAIAYALTSEQILQSIFVPASNSIRVAIQ